VSLFVDSPEIEGRNAVEAEAQKELLLLMIQNVLIK
jgi:hypothetical protein